MKRLNLRVERVGVSVHLAMAYASFAVWAVFVLCYIRVLSLFMQLKVIVDEVPSIRIIVCITRLSGDIRANI